MAPPKFRKDSRSNGPGGPKASRPPRNFKGGDFKGAPKGGPRGDFKGGPKGGSSRGDFKSDYKGGPKGAAPRGNFKGDGPRGDFKGAPRGDFTGSTRGDFKAGPKSDFKRAPKADFKKSDFKKGEFKGNSKGFKGARAPYRDVPQKQDRPRTDIRPPRPERGDRPAKHENWVYGIHAVQAALANPRRKLGRLLLTHRAAEIIGEERPDRIRVEIMEMDAIGKLLPPGAVHQGAAVEAKPLPAFDLDALLSESGPSENTKVRRRVVLVLDQLTDPHNVGAILRSAVAFGVTAVVVQDRHAPPQGGVLAKAASGALDLVPYVEVVNITRALEKLAEHGFWRIALAGDGAQSLQASIPDGDVALVLGSEGDGIRRLVREHCDTAALIPIDGAMESLNVSNAAAIALYELRRS